MDLSLEQLEDFVVLAAERHFGRAAARRNLSPSALSKRLQRLEHQVGVRLVERDGGGVTDLTDAGRRFLPHAQDTLRDAARGRRAALGVVGTEPLRLGIPGSPGDHLSPRAWQALVAGLELALPGRCLCARGVPYGQLADGVLTGRVDVLLTTDGVDHPGLVTVPLTTMGRVCLLPPHHPLAGAPTLTVADVADLPMIVEPTASPEWMAPWVLGDLRARRGTRTVEVRARCLTDVRAAVLAGTAVTLATDTLPPSARSRLCAPALTDAPPIQLGAVRRRGDDRDEVLALLEVLGLLAALAGIGR
ncbi:LysR family transcriptional regulator [Kocuria sabuli]|uniref:LysR substrate-binding domain-containing protein n=1 Tax=Kocuria sabuli TaxID=3071448 RepID=UPI0034D6F0CA